MITGGTTRKRREQGCFLFMSAYACGFVCLFFIFDGVNSKSRVILVFTGMFKEIKVSLVSINITINMCKVMYHQCQIGTIWGRTKIFKIQMRNDTFIAVLWFLFLDILSFNR